VKSGDRPGIVVESGKPQAERFDRHLTRARFVEPDSRQLKAAPQESEGPVLEQETRDAEIVRSGGGMGFFEEEPAKNAERRARELETHAGRGLESVCQLAADPGRVEGNEEGRGE
jgi:hypothetical protein